MKQRKSPRLKGYDYTQSGVYFVTICTHERQLLFGHIHQEEALMVLSAMGEIAQHHWITIPDHFPTVELDAFVVMPNHVHGLLVFSGHSDAVSLPDKTEAFGKPVAASLSTMIRSYKSIVTRKIREMTDTEIVVWQGRFHDHIVRNEKSLNYIRQYVMTNPAQWREDTFYA